MASSSGRTICKLYAPLPKGSWAKPNEAELEEVFKKKVSGKPKCVIAKTVKGKGVSFMENAVGWHGKAPNKEEYEKAMEELNKLD